MSIHQGIEILPAEPRMLHSRSIMRFQFSIIFPMSTEARAYAEVGSGVRQVQPGRIHPAKSLKQFTENHRGRLAQGQGDKFAVIPRLGVDKSFNVSGESHGSYSIDGVLRRLFEDHFFPAQAFHECIEFFQLLFRALANPPINILRKFQKHGFFDARCTIHMKSSLTGLGYLHKPLDKSRNTFCLSDISMYIHNVDCFR